MSRTTKNVIMVFTLACVIVLVVFCVELFLLNRDNGDRPDTTISNNEPIAPPVDDDPQIADAPPETDPPDVTDPEPAPPEDNNQPDDPITPPPDSQRYILLLSADTAELIFYVQMEHFEHETLGDGNGWLFTYLPGEDAWMEVSFVLVHPQGGTQELAQTFLDNYLDGDYSELQGERNIGNSSVRGIFVTGENEGETYDAWLRDLADLGADSLALIIVVRHSTDEERDMLYSILDTMHIHMLIEEDAEENGEDV